MSKALGMAVGCPCRPLHPRGHAHRDDWRRHLYTIPAKISQPALTLQKQTDHIVLRRFRVPISIRNRMAVLEQLGLRSRYGRTRSQTTSMQRHSVTHSNGRNACTHSNQQTTISSNTKSNKSIQHSQMLNCHRSILPRITPQRRCSLPV